MNEEELKEQNLLHLLNERGIVDDIMRSLEFQGLEEKQKTRNEQLQEHQHTVKEKLDVWVEGEKQKFPIDPNKRYIYLQILGGKAFLEHLQEEEVYPGQVSSTLSLHCHFMGQRFESRPVPCACEPAIEEGFLLEIKKVNDKDKPPDSRTLLPLSSKIHLVLIKTDRNSETHLLGSHYLEWRGILTSSTGQTRSAVEINGVGAESKVPVGIIDVKLDLIPRLPQVITSDVLQTQLTLEKNRLNERQRLFLAYSKQWWREFLQIRAAHSSRLVKIFAQDENSSHHFVCSYIKPLKAGRLLESAKQTARFVSLLRYEKHPTLSGSRTDMWTSMHSFIVRGKGDVEDHAVLLCTFLLGFGLNAYVCIGTKAKSVAHAWVVTITADGQVWFWESLTAHRYKHIPINPADTPAVPQPDRDYPYRSAGCVFNHKEFYANTQPTDSIHVCSFKLKDESLWKSMSTEAINSVCGEGLSPQPLSLVHLRPSSIEPIEKSFQLEAELRALVCDHRKDLGLATIWDEELSYLLSPALSAYELEHSCGVSTGNEDFQDAIRRNVPEGHTFKGFPIQFIHTNARRAFATCLKAAICEEIICCRGDQIKLAVRVRTFPYPEKTVATWVMFAVKYKSIL